MAEEGLGKLAGIDDVCRLCVRAIPGQRGSRKRPERHELGRIGGRLYRQLDRAPPNFGNLTRQADDQRGHREHAQLAHPPEDLTVGLGADWLADAPRRVEIQGLHSDGQPQDARGCHRRQQLRIGQQVVSAREGDKERR